MNWREMTIGKKIGAGFGIVLILLTIVGILSYTGTKGIVSNAEEVIDGNKLDGNLAQKEVDHLNWVNQVNALLTNDKVTKLEVETDDQKCGFGKWLYGEGRKEAEHLVPTLAPLLKEIEAPHKALHDSAIAIGKVFKQANPGLPTLFTQREVDHLKWAAKIRDVFIQKKDELGVQTDPAQCALGKWLTSDEARKAYQNGDMDFRQAWDAMVGTHKDLHQSAVAIESHLKYGELAELAKEKSTLHEDFEALSATLFATLEDAMKNIIDPAKAKAEKSGNISALGYWGNIDMIINEEVIQSFLLARMAMADYEHGKTESLWLAYEQEMAGFTTGLEDWAALAKNNPALKQTIKDLSRLGESWSLKARTYHQAIMDESQAEASVSKAISLYSDTTIPLLNLTMGHLAELRDEAEHELSGMRESSRIYSSQTVPALNRIQSLLSQIREEAKANIMTDDILLSSAKKTEFSVIILVSVAAVIGILMAFFISRGIIHILTNVTGGLGEGANQVASAASQVSSSSQSMAEGASQQAASIEETSSSMEEMSSMTRKNAENSVHADGLMKEANGVVKTAHDSMLELTRSMEDITRASEETSKIIKTIDEIAFQTNLLALNAAVEAARAGEAGAGFAVVADEVRNLAMRAANAAKDTSQLIESTVKKVENGSQIVAATNDAFTRVSESTSKVGELVAEISEASGEQSEGIEQVNTAISEMDRVVQQNAANAEESASASEELNAQAEQLRDYVGDLMMMVTGDKNIRTGQIGHTPVRQVEHQARGGSQKALDHSRKEVRPDQVIPFEDDEDFKDF
ncbi:MAG: methyl-accepting chemotaxis protein [Desulfobacterales bacterium]|nr:methyl-accepting chemotaxis protein [Desulfobacterales bacterium]